MTRAVSFDHLVGARAAVGCRSNLDDLRTPALNMLPGRISANRRLFKNFELLQPSQEGVRRRMGLFLTLRAFDSVQDFVALVDSGSNLLFASKTRSVRKIADDASILEMQLRREIELDRHTTKT
jgi:hypothetical protein